LWNPPPDGTATGFAIDAAAAVHAETALRRFVETLTETFAHLRVGLAIFDGTRRLGLFNPAFVDLMRLDPGWLAGRPKLEEVLGRMRDAGTLPESADHAAWRAELLALFDRPDAEDRDERWELPGETSLRVLARPHPQGAVALLIEDVSQTARLERRWSTEVEMRRATMDRLQEGVAAFGPDGSLRFANPAFARIWGFRPGEPGAPEGLAATCAAFRARSAASPEDGADLWDRLADFVTAPGGCAPLVGGGEILPTAAACTPAARHCP
jgi:FOG: PAS/PAC domain